MRQWICLLLTPAFGLALLAAAVAAQETIDKPKEPVPNRPGVTQSAPKPIAQPTSTVQHLLEPAMVRELPLINRNFARLVALAPGVSSDLPESDLTAWGPRPGAALGGELNLSLNGSRRSAINWLLDGVSNVDVGSNNALLVTPSLESIQEINILTANYSAEWPRSGGGVVQVVTKSGTSRFSGSTYEFFRHDALNANWLFRKMDWHPDVRDAPPRLRYHNFGYTLGGPGLPSRKNLFFFVSQEWRRMSTEPITLWARVPDPAWLTDPTQWRYVPPEERDPIAVKLLAAWPAPNVPGTNSFRTTYRDPHDTRQEVVRLDYQPAVHWVLTGRYTHDLYETLQSRQGSIGFNSSTTTDLAGEVAMVQVRNAGGPVFKEVSYQLARRASSTNPLESLKTTRSGLGIDIPEVFPGNRGDLIPNIEMWETDDLFLVSAQPASSRYCNHSVSGSLTLQRGRHAIKTGALMTFEQKTEPSPYGTTQGRFGFSGFSSFLRGGPGDYYEDAIELGSDLRFNRHELYVQDTWSARPNVTIDLGVRYSLYSPVTDQNDRLAAFSAESYDPAQAPTFVGECRCQRVPGTGNPLNGIYIAGANSPYGRAVYPRDTNNVQPRLGLSWSPAASGTTVVRGGYGVYFNQPQAGIFRSEQDGFIRLWDQGRVSVSNTKLSDPRSGNLVPPFPRNSSSPALALPSPSFRTPRTAHWNVSVQQQFYRHGWIDLAYVGTRGDQLIRLVDINERRLEDLGTAFPESSPRSRYPGYLSIILRETSARSRYHGLQASFRHQAARASLVLNYTLSRNRTDASNDDEMIDIPQNPDDPGAEFALARTDRTHVFAAYYVYQLPFFDAAAPSVGKALLGGWQIAGITAIESGPTARVLGSASALQRNLRPNQVGDPRAGKQDGLFWFDPDAFQRPPIGTYGTAPVAPFRLPGRHQWDIAVSKHMALAGPVRLQFRADFINAFNHTQFLDVYTRCTRTPCSVPVTPFGRVTSTRAPREIQLGLRLYW